MPQSSTRRGRLREPPIYLFVHRLYTLIYILLSRLDMCQKYSKAKIRKRYTQRWSVLSAFCSQCRRTLRFPLGWIPVGRWSKNRLILEVEADPSCVSAGSRVPSILHVSTQTFYGSVDFLSCNVVIYTDVSSLWWELFHSHVMGPEADFSVLKCHICLNDLHIRSIVQVWRWPSTVKHAV